MLNRPFQLYDVDEIQKILKQNHASLKVRSKNAQKYKKGEQGFRNIPQLQFRCSD